MKNKKLLAGFVIAVILLLALETYIYVNNTKFKKKEIHISFVLSGDNLDRWENLKSGAEIAALDEECFVDFVNSPLEYGFSGEVDLINRQFADGADYVMVATSDYKAMKEFVTKSGLSDKVLFIKNGLYGDTKNSFLTDDYALACSYGEYIIDTMKEGKLIMVTTSEDVNTMEMKRGLEDTLEDSSVDVEYRLMSATSGTLNQSMYNLGQSGLYDGFITLDYETVEAAAKAQNKLNRPVQVYSVDNSSAAVYYLDSNMLNGLLFKDDYSMGYLAVKEVLKTSGTSKLLEEYNKCYIIDKSNIHTEKMEKVLFPFVK